MSRDNWERLVAAVIKREQIWQLCHDDSRSPTISTTSSDSRELIPNNGMELNSLSPSPEGTLSKSSSYQGNGGSAVTTPVVDKSIEFSYKELEKATNNFSIANKIGEFVYGYVYYAELRGVKAAIKKMDMQACKYFLSELKVLTHIQHLNMVHLMGYCVEASLFLVYDYIENGDLHQHLLDSGREPLPWSTRIQIALDAARGLEYIHENTLPLYIHCNIKAANILLDENFHGKVAGFGFGKYIRAGNNSLTSTIVGTFGYMAPEYIIHGDVSPKVDVYAFGVVIYELISAMEAVVKKNGSDADPISLIALFEEVLSKPGPSQDLKKLVDPRLGDGYPFDSVLKAAQLARACTHKNPQLRPSMRSVVVALMTLSSSVDNWDVDNYYREQGF